MGYLRHLVRLATSAIAGMWVMGVVWTLGVMFIEKLEDWMTVSPISGGIFACAVIICGAWIGITAFDRR